jgi:sugar/nucleoside kinase (ribokinase family)
MESGSLKVAASDFRIVEQSLSADFVISRLGDIGQGDFLVLDANLSPRLLADLARRYADRTRLVFEPVSVEKALRHVEALHDLYLLTPTVEELRSLTSDVHAFMAERRILNILVTRGSEGAQLYRREGGQEDFPPSAVVRAQDTTGAGDLLLAALLSRLHAGEEMAAAVRGAMSFVEGRLQRGAL